MIDTIPTRKQVPAHSVAEIFDDRSSRPADVGVTVQQMGVMHRAALGLHDGVSDSADGYIKFKMGARSRWLWVRLNGSDLYDMRVTRYNRHALVHCVEWGVNDLDAANLPDVLTALRSNY